MLKFTNFFIKFSIIFLITFTLLIFSTLWYFSIGLPDYKKLSNYQPPISTRVYSDNGKLIAEYALQKRLFVPYESIPEVVVNSFLSAEDKNFFNHPGIDAKGILRAVINNLISPSEANQVIGQTNSMIDFNTVSSAMKNLGLSIITTKVVGAHYEIEVSR